MSEQSTLVRVFTTLNPWSGYHVKPFGFVWRTSTLFIIVTVGIGLFTDLFLYSLVVPLLPHILADRVHLPQEQIQSYVSVLLATYAGSSVVLSPIAGVIADRTSSRQLPFLFGLTCLIIATAVLFTGSTIPVLIIARIGQGASSAFVWTVGLALCMDTVGPKNLGKVIGSIFSFVYIGGLFAPPIGGAIYQRVGYTAVGALALSLLGVDFIMRLLVIEKKVAARYDALDPSYQYIQRNSEEDQALDGEDDENSPLLRTQSDPSAFFIPPSIPSWYHRVPMMYPLLHSPSLIVACATAAVQAILLGSFDATVPTHANELFGFDAFKAGMLFVPLGAINCIIGPAAGWCVDRYGVKIVAVAGFTLITPALALLRLPESEPQTPMIVLYSALLACCGIGLAMADSPSIVESGAVIDRYHKRNPGFFGEQGPYAQLYGINSMVFNFGLTIGPELAGELKRVIGYGNMTAVLAVLSGLSAIASYIWLGGKPKALQHKPD